MKQSRKFEYSNINRSLVVKFLEGQNTNEILAFGPESKPITFGRDENSVVRFPSGSLSRHQCK